MDINVMYDSYNVYFFFSVKARKKIGRYQWLRSRYVLVFCLKEIFNFFLVDNMIMQIYNLIINLWQIRDNIKHERDDKMANPAKAGRESTVSYISKHQILSYFYHQFNNFVKNINVLDIERYYVSCNCRQMCGVPEGA